MAADRFALAVLPTPLHRLDRLSRRAGADIWAKRDDLAGFAMGGNKVRKAEYLVADALAEGADTLITAGAAQSNHARAIAAAARCAGLACRLVLSGRPPAEPVGNLLLDELSGAAVRFVAASAERQAAMDEEARAVHDAGGRPYVIPIGGSNGVGAQGYVNAYREIAAQLGALPPKPARLVFASSSGGTYGGLLAGSAIVPAGIRLLGIRVDLDPGAEETICEAANGALGRLGRPPTLTPLDAALDASFVGEGYGLPTPAGMAALRLLWQDEGILLDPVYTAKAMAGLLGLAAAGAFAGERVIFVHTGGEPSVFAQGPAILGARQDPGNRPGY